MKKLRLVLMAWFLGGLLASPLAQPAVTPDMALMNLDELGVYSVGFVLRGQAEQKFPLGWSGFFDERTGVACQPFGAQNGKRAFFMHSPWKLGAGVTYQQFVFSLPSQASRIVLRGATAMRSDNVTNSDGVTFRLFAGGRKLFDYHQTNDVWRPYEFDLTSMRGSKISVRFEVDPGPNNNASFDYSLWGDRELVLEGYAPPVLAHPAPPPMVLSNLWSGQAAEVTPPSAFAGSSSTSLSNGTARFRYSGPDGVIEYRWKEPSSAADGLFGTLNADVQMTGDAPVTVPLAVSAAITWTQTASPVANGWIQTNSGCILWRTFKVGTDTATVRMEGCLSGKSLVLAVTCDQPLASAFDSGGWGPVVRRRQLPAPYYPGQAYYLHQEGLFANAVLDWTSSAASSHNGTKANYDALTDGKRNLLRERAIFTAAWHLAEVLPNPPNPPSPWREFLANKIVLDIWGGTFSSITNNLHKLTDYGISNCVAIIHDWQRSGYDNALPMHYPANSSYGGDPGMSALVEAGARLGIRCALHENYVDYYPNYDFYATNDIALDSAGKLQLAWYNPGTHIQSYAIQPNAIMRLAATQSPEIHRRYATEANYLDVHSAVPPWFHVDMRASEADAGRFSRVWEVHRQLWAYERETHKGPVFGEGNNHWYWSGLLDGAEAQFGSGWPINGGFSAPLAVDFDLLKIHPLQFNHGMGYLNRWWPTETYSTNWGGTVPMVVLDRYRMQEAAFGHAGFLDGSVYANVPLAWLEHHLLSPVMERYAQSRPVEIRYETNGVWIDSTAAAKSDFADVWSRVRIRYENGLTITANGGTNSLSSGSWQIPDLGWVAEGAGIAAGTILRSGSIADFADTGDSLFVNARAAKDWNLSNYRRVHPSVSAFSQTGARAFRASYKWESQDILPKNYSCFVHFSSNGVIRAQQDHPLATPSSQWLPGQTVTDGPWNITLPSTLPDGDYDWMIGLFDPTGDGSRVPLQGLDDGTLRIRLGTLRLTNSGKTLVFTAETNTSANDPAAWYTRHLNASNNIVDFGDIRTDGSVLLWRTGDVWHLKTWPRERNFTLEFNSSRFAQPGKVQSSGGGAGEVSPVQTSTGWKLPLNGAAEYRWTNAPPRLSILRTNQDIVISWPASAEGFKLESAPNLAATEGWEPVTNAVIQTNGQLSAVLPALDPVRFHRLNIRRF